MTTPTPTPEEIEALARELLGDIRTTDPRYLSTWILTRFVRREEHEQVRAWSKSFANENKELFAENSRLRAELRGQRCDGSGRLHGRASTPIAGVIGHVAGELGCYGCPACKPEAAPKGECECGHVREQHTQGCRMIGCDCPYYAPPDATPKGDGHEHLWISTSWGRPRCEKCGKWATDDRSRAIDGVSTAETPKGGDTAASASGPAAPVTLDDALQHAKSAIALAEEARKTYQIIADSHYADGYSAGHDDAARFNVKQVEHVVELGPATLRALVEAILELQYTQHPRQCRPATADDLLAHLKETKP